MPGVGLQSSKIWGSQFLMIQQNCIVIWVKKAYFGPGLTQSIMLIRHKITKANLVAKLT